MCFNFRANHLDELPLAVEQPIVWWPEVEDNFPDLLVERVVPTTNAAFTEKPATPLSGNLVVDIGHLSEQFAEKDRHRDVCTFGKMAFIREERCGLVSTLVHKCNQCNKELRITTQPREKIEAFNEAAVWGSLSIGVGHSQVEELFSMLDLGFMSDRKYRRHEKVIERVIICLCNHFIKPLKAPNRL